MKSTTDNINDSLQMKVNEQRSPVSGLVEKAYQQRKQAQLDAQSALEKTLNACIRDARRVTVRMRARHQPQSTQGE